MRRIVGKAISWCLRDDIQEAAGPLQVSAGLKGGAEAAIHAMKEIYKLETTDAVILVDAANAFNRLNRAVALHNVQYMPHIRHSPHQHIQITSEALHHQWRRNQILGGNHPRLSAGYALLWNQCHTYHLGPRLQIQQTTIGRSSSVAGRRCHRGWEIGKPENLVGILDQRGGEVWLLR